jgi:MATE family, multidrug efflux pump
MRAAVRSLDEDFRAPSCYKPTGPMTRYDSFRTELSAAARLAAPVALVQLGMMLMGVVDTIMLGHLSAGALAAGALGHMVTISLLMIGYGVLTALDPLVSQAFGAGDHRAVGDHLQRGLVMAAALTVPFALAAWDIRGLLRPVEAPGTAPAPGSFPPALPFVGG